MPNNLNFTNPYYAAGQLHNQGVDFVIKYLRAPINIEQILEATARYMEDIICTCFQEDESQKYKNQYGIYFEFLANNYNKLRKYSLEDICKEHKVKDNIILTLNNILDIPDALDINAQIMLVDQHENTIIRTRLEDEDIKVVLFAIAVSKASLNYKKEFEAENGEKATERKKLLSLTSEAPPSPSDSAQSNPLAEGHDQSKQSTSKVSNESKVSKVLKWWWKADKRGAAAGYLAGSVAGVLGGPVGVAGGAILGGVGTGVAESVIKAFYPQSE